VPTDRECIFLSSRHFGIRRHVFARRIEPRVFVDAGEPFPREIQKITTEEIVQPGCPRRFIPNVFRLRQPLVMTSLTQFRARQRYPRVLESC